ncbi:MAG: thiamine pyrophosphate-dependent dehydrogenase E1 component subunit alpha [Thermodesulfobacteriota bacterium]
MNDTADVSFTAEDMAAIPQKTLLELYTTMLRIRMFEEKIVELYPAQEMKCPVHLCIGQEAIAAGLCQTLKSDDYMVSNHRGHGHGLAKGASMKALLAEFYGRTTGCSRGKGGSMHIIDTAHGVLGTSAIVGGGLPLGVGTALASSIKGDNRVSVVFFGDGAFDEGVFYESFNFAILKKLPVVFVCENNFFATNSPQSSRQGTCEIARIAGAYGAPGICIDGNNVVEVYNAAVEAVKHARRGHGPSLIEATTYRWKGHVGPEVDYEKGARSKEELLGWMKKCPVKNFEKALMQGGFIRAEELDAVQKNITQELDEALSFALESPLPHPGDLYEDLYQVN